jgi:phosphoglycerate dehydrogenase-like enzyme
MASEPGRPTIFLLPRDTEPPQTLVDALSAIAHVIVGRTGNDFLPVADQVEAIITWAGGNPRLFLEPMETLPTKLRWVSHSGIGVDQFLYPALIESEVVVTNMRGVTGYSAAMAEYAFSLMLMFAKELIQIERNRVQHEWIRVMHRALYGKALGIIGLGTIGSALASRSQAFGMTVTATRRNPEGEMVNGVRILPHTRLDELLSTSDYVVICAPRTPETHGLIGAEALRLMKPDAVLINIARGGMVDEAALVEALRAGRLRGAGLDVFANEPLPADDPLWDEDRLFISPHMSAFVDTPWPEQHEAILENARRFARGEPLLRVVDKRRGY